MMKNPMTTVKMSAIRLRIRDDTGPSRIRANANKSPIPMAPATIILIPNFDVDTSLLITLTNSTWNNHTGQAY